MVFHNTLRVSVMPASTATSYSRFQAMLTAQWFYHASELLWFHAMTPFMRAPIDYVSLRRLVLRCPLDIERSSRSAIFRAQCCQCMCHLRPTNIFSLLLGRTATSTRSSQSSPSLESDVVYGLLEMVVLTYRSQSLLELLPYVLTA